MLLRPHLLDNKLTHDTRKQTARHGRGYNLASKDRKDIGNGPLGNQSVGIEKKEVRLFHAPAHSAFPQCSLRMQASSYT